jgi:hypothetical protein
MDASEYQQQEFVSSTLELLERELQAVSWASLDFRAAANSAVELAKRPIKSRVLKRVNSSAEFRALCLSILRPCASEVFQLGDLSPSDGLKKLSNSLRNRELVEDRLLPEFYQRLSQDQRFSTLVLEAIETVKRWDDLLGSGFRSLGDRLRAGFDKIFDKDHPASRAVASLILSGASLILAYRVTVKVAPGVVQDIQIPVRLDLVRPTDSFAVRLDLGSASQTVPIRFTAPEPVTLAFEPKNPVKLSIAASLAHGLGSKSNSADVSGIVEKLDILNRQIGEVSPALAAAGSAQKNDLVSAVRSVATSLDGVSNSMSNLVNVTDGNGKKLESLGSNLTDAELHARSFQGVVSSVQAATSIVVPENETGRVFLQWLDENQEPTSCTVAIKISGAKSPKTLYDLGLTVDECSSTPPALLGELWGKSVQTGLNHPIWLGRNIPFHVTLITAEHPLFGRTRILLRFQPDATRPQTVTANTLTRATAQQVGRSQK